MPFLKFNNKILFLYAAVFFVLITLFLIYASKINIYEDLKIEIEPSTKAQVILITPLGKEVKLKSEIDGTYKTEQTYAAKLLIKLSPDLSITNINKIIINGKEINVQSNQTNNSNDYLILDIPYKTDKNFAIKTNYIVLSNLPFVKKSNNLLLLIIALILSISILLIIALKKESKKHFVLRIREHLNIRQIKSLFKKPYFQLSLFALLWLTLLLLTIC
jgi:hypothetical protein